MIKFMSAIVVLILAVFSISLLSSCPGGDSADTETTSPTGSGSETVTLEVATPPEGEEGTEEDNEEEEAPDDEGGSEHPEHPTSS